MNSRTPHRALSLAGPLVGMLLGATALATPAEPMAPSGTVPAGAPPPPSQASQAPVQPGAPSVTPPPAGADAPPGPVSSPPSAAPVAQPEPVGNPFAPANVIQENGDWERHLIAPHVPIGLGPMMPFGAIDKRAGALGDNAGTFTSFELGVGLRVRRVLVDLMFAIGGAGGRSGPTQAALASLGYTPGGVLRIFGGVDAAYYLARTEVWAPWVGGRLGYESLVFNGSSGSYGDAAYDYSGMYLAARGGIDWRIAPAFGIGPYFELGGGTAFSAKARQSIDDDPSTFADESVTYESDVTVDGSTLHGFFGGGVRMVFFP